MEAFRSHEAVAPNDDDPSLEKGYLSPSSISCCLFGPAKDNTISNFVCLVDFVLLGRIFFNIITGCVLFFNKIKM